MYADNTIIVVRTDTDMSRPTEISSADLRDNLRQAMKRRALTCRDLAQRSGVDKSTISRWCLGRGSVRVATAERVATALQISVDALIGPDETQARCVPSRPDPAEGAQELLTQLAELAETLQRAADTVTPDLMAALNQAAEVAREANELSG